MLSLLRMSMPFKVENRGEYLEPTAKVGRAMNIAYDDALAKELWEFSIKMVEEVTGENIDYKNDN